MFVEPWRAATKRWTRGVRDERARAQDQEGHAHPDRGGGCGVGRKPEAEFSEGVTSAIRQLNSIIAYIQAVKHRRPPGGWGTAPRPVHEGMLTWFIARCG